MSSGFPSKIRKNSQSESDPWVLVNVNSIESGNFSAHREPQLKSSNMGSGQMACASAAHDCSSVGHLSQQLVYLRFEDDEYVPGSPAVSDDSNQTEETLRQAGLAAALHDYPTAPHPLTAGYLELHDRQLAEMSYTLSGWTEANRSQRLAQMAAPTRGSKNGTKRRRSQTYSNRVVEYHRPSTISSGGMTEWGMANNPGQAADEIAGSGTCFDDVATGAAVYAAPFLMIDE